MPVTGFEFGDFQLDRLSFELRRGGTTLKLERKPLELLILLAERSGQLVSRSEIAERLWDREVYVDTEHGINTAVRKIRLALKDDAEEPRFVQTVLGKGYRFVGLIEEIQTPEAIPPAGQAIALEPAARTASRTQASWRMRGDALVMAGTLLGVALLAVSWHWYVDRSPARAQPRIQALAVLPLENLSGDPAQEYFADGMTDELITMLAKSSKLRIVSRTSVMQYKRVHRPLTEVARELGVDGVLEGSVARSGDKVHLNVQLLAAATDSHLWAESYDRSASDQSSLPRDAAETIARVLGQSVTIAAPRLSVLPEAHDAYLHGRYLWFGDQDDKALAYFRTAVRLQPDYAAGWSGISICYGAGAIRGDWDPRTSLAASEDAARKAVALDQGLAEAHNALAAAVMINRWDFAGSDRESAKAIELDPNFAEAYHLRAKMLAVTNRHADAIAMQQKTTELDPFARHWALMLSYLVARRYDEALQDGLHRSEAAPGDENLSFLLATVYEYKGMYKEAVSSLDKYYRMRGEAASADKLQKLFAQGGFRAVMLWDQENLRALVGKQYVSPYRLARVSGRLGEREETLKWLEAGYRERSPLLLWMESEPAFDFVHEEARYRAIVKGMGLPA